MLVKVPGNRHLNFDYVILIRLLDPSLNTKTPGVTKWGVQITLIDNSIHKFEYEDEKEALKEYQKFIREANKRIKEIKYE